MYQTTLLLIMNVKSAAALVVSIVLAFIAPIVPLLVITFGAILLDTLFGLIKAHKLKITSSHGFSAIAKKLVLYLGAIILSFCAEKYILSDVIGLFCQIPLIGTKLVTAILLGVEAMSINENWFIISGINLWQKAKLLLSRTKQIKEDIESLTDTKKKDEAKKEDTKPEGDVSDNKEK